MCYYVKFNGITKIIATDVGALVGRAFQLNHAIKNHICIRCDIGCNGQWAMVVNGQWASVQWRGQWVPLKGAIGNEGQAAQGRMKVLKLASYSPFTIDHFVI